MRRQRFIAAGLLALGLGLVIADRAGAVDPVVEARQTLAIFMKADPGLQKFVDDSSGYAVFPSVAKGAVAVGGAHGSGVLFARGDTPVSRVTMTQVTVGLQLGGGSYSEVIFFQNPKVFNKFKSGDFALAAQVSAVALSRGAAKSAEYEDGVAVFTATNSGLMFEAAVGGQKFNVKPLD